MATNKKKKKKPSSKPVQQDMSPKEYLLAGRARLLEVHECLINADYKEGGMAAIIIARKHKTGNITFGSFVVDIFCLGVKDATAAFNRTEEDYEYYKGKIYGSMNPDMPISYDLAHNIIFGAIDYAKKLGFSPHKDWEHCQFILEPKTSPNVEKMELNFGKDGKPFFISGPYDKVDSIVQKLEKAVGKGNFEVVLNLGGGDFGFDDMDFMDEEDDDDFDEDEDKTEDTDYEEVKS